MIRRRARDILALATLLVGCASLPPSRPIDSAASLAGTWRGRMSGFLGNAPVILTIKDDGSYQGILFVEPTYKEVGGMIMVVRWASARYHGTNGTGRVTLHEEGGRRVLRLVDDGGGGGTQLTPAE